MSSGNPFIHSNTTYSIVLDPIFPSPDYSSNRKYSINDIPQEIKFRLIFDELIEGSELNNKKRYYQSQNNCSIIKEEIESDKEDQL